MTNIEKISTMMIALFLAIFLFVSLSSHLSKEESTCKSFCDLYDSLVRIHEAGVCICQK